MPRRLRYIVPGLPHHIVQRGNNRQYVLADDNDKRFFLKKMREYAMEERVGVAAYCIMSNHVHILAYPAQEAGLVRFMKMTSQVYTQHINCKYKRTGKLWENRYKMHLVDPKKVLNVVRYIDLNPVRARMVERPEEYQFSSCRGHATITKDSNITYDCIAGQYTAYRIFLDEREAYDDIKEVRATLEQQKIWGSEDFIESIEALFGRVLRMRGTGRPKKRGKVV